MKALSHDKWDELEKVHVSTLSKGIDAQVAALINKYQKTKRPAKDVRAKVCAYLELIRKCSAQTLLKMDVMAMRKIVGEVDAILPIGKFHLVRSKKKKTELAFKKVNKELAKIFDYGDFADAKTGWCLSKLAEILFRQLKVCPYCNAETVYYYEVKSKGKKGIQPHFVKSAFDHYFPRSRYPFLGISLYNLIPSCTRCNSSFKGDEYKGLSGMAHPHLESVGDANVCETAKDMHSGMKFHVLLSNVKALSWCSGDDISDIVLSERKYGGYPEGVAWERLFHLSETYSGLYRDEAADMLCKIVGYPKSCLEETATLLKKHGFPQPRIDMLLYGIQREDERINFHRLSKLFIDIADTYRRGH